MGAREMHGAGGGTVVLIANTEEVKNCLKLTELEIQACGQKD